MTRSCALCGFRDAIEWTDLDDRKVPACATCLAPLGDVPEYLEIDGDTMSARDLVLRVVRVLGTATTADIASHVGTVRGEARYNAITVAVSRLARSHRLAVVKRENKVATYSLKAAS